MKIRFKTTTSEVILETEGIEEVEIRDDMIGLAENPIWLILIDRDTSQSSYTFATKEEAQTVFDKIWENVKPITIDNGIECINYEKLPKCEKCGIKAGGYLGTVFCDDCCPRG